MAILINEKTKVLIQGITGVSAVSFSRYNKEYGTNVVAGVTPGRAGEEVNGIPVYNSVEEAVENVGVIDASWVSVPAPMVKEAAFEAIEAGIKLVILFPDRVPVHDTMEIVAFAQDMGVKVIGPNTPGLISPGKAVIGATGGSVKLARQIYTPGPVGVLSRSGGITTTLGNLLTDEGLGQSTCIGVGGDPIVGTPFAPMLLEFEKDPQTKVVVMYGEIGTSQEEDAALVMKKGLFNKPLIVIIGGRSIAPGIRFSHAGAIVEGNRGTAENKIKMLEDAGAIVVENLQEIPGLVKSVLS